MNKTTAVGIVLALVIIGAGAFYFLPKSTNTANPPSQTGTAFDGKNSSFTIDGKQVSLTNGVSQVPAASNSATMVTTRYFGNEATGDLNADGLPDTAFLVTQDTGGSGTFYYVVVALNTGNGYKTTNAFLIGDRIAPQSTEIHSDSEELHVNFAQRNPWRAYDCTTFSWSCAFAQGNS
jgi:hypothetical protein